MNKQQVTKYFKWWYLNDAEKSISRYPDLLGRKSASLVAMTRDGKVIKQSVPLSVDHEIAIADLGEDGKYYLSPNQWVSPTSAERIKKFWLADRENHFNDALINGIFEALEDGKACLLPPEQGVTLFGKTSRNTSTLARRQVEALVPIGEDEFIAWDGHFASIVGDRETDDSVIKILLDRIS